MKKTATIALAAALLLAGSVNTFAASANQDDNTGLGSTFVYTHQNDPTYTVTIPAQIALQKDGTTVEIQVSDTANLDGKKVSVTVAGTDYYRNQFVLENNPGSGPKTSIRYSLTLADGTVLETTGGKDEHVGKELASFDGDGAVSYTVTPILKSDTKAGADYTGTLTYGIELV